VTDFHSLDFLYTPSTNVAADRDYFVDVLGAREVFAIEAGDDRVAAIQLAERPLILFADHLEGERPFMIFRVDDVEAAMAAIQARGLPPADRFEIPHGPCCTFETPSGHRVGVYQVTRPEVIDHFAGRHDF
jgi:hypothetical protein